jgi:hypothetical protein
VIEGEDVDSCLAYNFHIFVADIIFNIHCDSRPLEKALRPIVEFFYQTNNGSHSEALCDLVVTQSASGPYVPVTIGPREQIALVAYAGDEDWAQRSWYSDWEILESHGGLVSYAICRPRHIIALSGRLETDMRRAFLRTLRTALDSCLAYRGWTRFHAAAIVHHNVAFALAGDSGSGKTTLLLDLLTNIENGRVLAFDTLFAKVSDAAIQCIGIPDSFGIAIGTAKRFTRFLEYFPTELQDLSSIELWRERSPRRKARISPEELTGILRAAREGPYKLGGLLFPVIDPSHETRAEALSKNALSELLMPNILSLPSSNRPDWLGIWHSETAPESIQKTVNTIRDRVSSYKLEFGADSPSKSSHVRELLMSVSDNSDT